MFSPVYKHVVLTRQAVLQQEVDYLLEIGASGRYGYISSSMINDSKMRLANLGLQQSLLDYTVSSTQNYIPTEQNPLPRGESISLSISYPYENLFMIDSLVGITPIGATERMRAYGIKMSEYVNQGPNE